VAVQPGGRPSAAQIVGPCGRRWQRTVEIYLVSSRTSMTQTLEILPVIQNALDYVVNWITSFRHLDHVVS
jgi:hypothetical protein